MLTKIRVWQHLVVALAIAAVTLLAGFRVIGAGDDALIRPEHFDAKQVTVQPVDGADGGDGVRIREVVDVDFGLTRRRGYQRIVPNDFGVPADVTASSPDAEAGVDVVVFGDETRIRVGDPAVTFTGRHRYVLEYTLPEANLSSGRLALDIIGNDETFETQRFEVVLTGFEFDGTTCNVGSRGTFGGCELERNDAGNHVVVIELLAPGDGITVEGTVTGFTEPSPPAIPEPPAPRGSGFRPFGLLMVPLGVAAAGAVFVWGRRYGSNEVAGAGGAADAAFGDLPVPGSGDAVADVGTYRVPDARLAEMATIEFSPPRGLEPWHGAVLLRESVDDESTSAWFSEMVARDAIVVTTNDGDPTISRGPGVMRLSALDQAHIARLFSERDEVPLGTYDEKFTAVWKTVQREQRRFAGAAGWWSRGGPGSSGTAPAKVAVAVALASVAVLVAAVVLGTDTAWRILASPAVAIGIGFVVPLLVAAVAYRRLFPARTATGSALTLRTESFRRFLAASEGRHVDWAWERGLVREYSAWAVALGAADAWTRAIESSNIPDPDVALAGPLLVYTAGSAFRASHTPPSSSGGGGGGGGGGVGGGGGGGSSGSW